MYNDQRELILRPIVFTCNKLPLASGKFRSQWVKSFRVVHGNDECVYQYSTLVNDQVWARVRHSAVIYLRILGLYIILTSYPCLDISALLYNF